MRSFKRTIVLVLIAFSTPGAVFADDPSLHELYSIDDYPYINENWRFGCLLFNYFDQAQNATHTYFKDACWVKAPAGASGVYQYGFSFNSSSTAHFGTGSTTNDGMSNPGAWTYSGAVDVEKLITPIVKRLSDGARLYMDQLSYNWYFWYTAPGDPTQLYAGGSGSTLQQKKYAPD